MKRSAPKSSGFTLLELLVVMVIIGLLAGYVGIESMGSDSIDSAPVWPAKQRLPFVTH